MGQLGQTSLAVVPNMRGLRSKVNAESKSAAKLAGRSMSDEFGKSADRSGKLFGRAFKSGAADAQRAVQQTTRANAAATSAWSKANRTHEDALGRVRVAQAKLSEATAKYGSDSSQAIAAQERLAAAQRKSEETAVQLKNAQERLTAATQAMKAAQDAASKSAGSSVWARMAKDLQPVSSRINAVVGKVREWAGTSRLLQPFRTALDNMGSGLAKATLATYNFGASMKNRVGKVATETGQKLSGAFNGFLVQHPKLNMAFTKISDGVKSLGQRVVGAGQVFGGLGRAAMTGISGIGQALGPGLSSAWSGLRTQISGAATAFTSVLGGAAVVAGGMIAGALGKAVVGGFSRLSNIENAEAKMRGLGFAAADIDSAMAGASAAVDGTAFALDEMASAASVAMAAGVKPGEALNKYMATLKNSAAAAGAPLADMGAILNKTLTSGRAQTQEINQIADRGLPIWTKLQEQYGVTADELRDMVSRGEVDTATFMQVMDDMTGKVADEMGGTTSSSIKNFGAALSKLGADMLQGLYPVIGPLFEALKSGVQMIQTFGAPAFEAFGAIFAPLGEKLTAFSDGWNRVKEAMAEGATPFEALREHMPAVADLFERVQGAVQPMLDTFSGMGSALAPVIGGLLGALGPLLTKIPILGKAFTGLTGPVGILIGAFIAMWQQSESLRDAVGTVFQTILDAVMAVLPSLLPIFETLGEVINQLAGVFGDVLGAALMAVAPLIEPLLGVVMTLLEAVTPLLPIIGTFAELLGGILVTALTALTPLFEFVGEVLTMLQPIIMMVADVVAQLLEALIPLLEPIGQLIGALLPPLIDLFITVLGPIMQLVGVIIGALMPVIQGLINMFSGLIQFVVGVFTGNWKQAWNGIKQFFSGFVDAIAGLVKGIGKIIGGIYDTIMDVLGGIGSWLIDSGKALIQGFIDGIKNMIGAVGDAVGGIMDFVGGFFPSSPAKRGPLSGAGWRRLRQSGVAYMDQWTLGVEDGARAFNVDALVNAADSAPSWREMNAQQAAASQRGLSVEVPVEVNMIERDPERVGRAIGRGLEVALGDA